MTQNSPKRRSGWPRNYFEFVLFFVEFIGASAFFGLVAMIGLWIYLVYAAG